MNIYAVNELFPLIMLKKPAVFKSTCHYKTDNVPDRVHQGSASYS